ncbi:hypothetical protein HHI36_010097 [Cryptolaemus montrouzieri]|uniref:Uncharacterized protein n=1 Tax=Cryptolaemus montrouzieri TaxID=559131 RepID=A0ABD2MHW3_9CUCU
MDGAEQVFSVMLEPRHVFTSRRNYINAENNSCKDNSRWRSRSYKGNYNRNLHNNRMNNNNSINGLSKTGYGYRTRIITNTELKQREYKECLTGWKPNFRNLASNWVPTHN